MGLADVGPAFKQKLDDAIAALKSAQEAYQRALAGITDAKATDKKASEVLAEKLAALKDAEAKLQNAGEALTKATEQAKSSKEAYDKLVQIKNEIDNATKPDEGEDNTTKPDEGEDNAAKPDEGEDDATKPDEKDNTIKSDEGNTTQGIIKSSDASDRNSGKSKGSVKLTKDAKELGKTGASTVWATIVGSVMALLGMGGVAVASKRRENN